MKRCNRCDHELPFSNFHRNGSRYYSLCKQCKRANYSVLATMLRAARYRAKSAGRTCTLTRTDIETLRTQQDNRCALTGVTMNWKPGNSGKQRVCPPDRASLDRIDSTKGYTPNNVQLVTDIANRIKLHHDQEAFITFCQKVAARHPDQ